MPGIILILYSCSATIGIWDLIIRLALKIEEYKAPHNNQKHDEIIKEFKEINEINKYMLIVVILQTIWIGLIICLYLLFDFNVGDNIALFGIASIWLYWIIKQTQKQHLYKIKNNTINHLRTCKISDYIRYTRMFSTIIFASIFKMIFIMIFIAIIIIMILLIYISMAVDQKAVPVYNVSDLYNITNF